MTTRRRRPAEVLADLVGELLEEVTTSEQLAGSRRVNRRGRSVAMAETLVHRTREPGLLDQLQAIASRPARRLDRTPITTVHTEDDGERRRVQLRAEVLDDRGRHLLRPQWDREQRRTVSEPVTVPLTRVVRVPVGASGAAPAGVVRPGAMVPGGSAGWDADGALAPTGRGSAESRPPVTGALDVLLDIHRQARHLYRRMLRAAQQAGHTNQARPRRGLDAILRHMVSLAAELDDATATAAVQAVRSWVRTARQLIGYDAPIVHLRDICCWDPNCGGRLAVSADGSTPVWCTRMRIEQGPARADEDWPLFRRCPVVYKRAQWLDLFTPGGTAPIGDAPRRRLPHTTDSIEGHGGRA